MLSIVLVAICAWVLVALLLGPLVGRALLRSRRAAAGPQQGVLPARYRLSDNVTMRVPVA
jgi:hypothetical protein